VPSRAAALQTKQAAAMAH